MNQKLRRAPVIYLAGFMGSGKTTIGKSLAEELGWSFADIDDDIEETAGMAIPRIFEEKGEAEFRAMESKALSARIRQAMTGRPMVLALGGGAFVQPENAARMRDQGVSIWLDCPFEKIRERVAKADHRPLARDPEAFAKLFEQRREEYSKADFRIGITSDDPMVAVRAITSLEGLL